MRIAFTFLSRLNDTSGDCRSGTSAVSRAYRRNGEKNDGQRPKRKEPDIPEPQPDIKPDPRPEEIPQDNDLHEKESPPVQL
jgi:hypothetical protein